MSFLEVKNLHVQLDLNSQSVEALRDVSFTLESGKTLGLVGESGCGKSLTSLALMGLLPPMAKISQGKILFQGINLGQLSERKFKDIRGKSMSMIFQDPMSALDPCYTVGEQIVEMILAHENITNQQAKNRALELMSLVGITEAKQRFSCFPHQFSGGMCQRVMLAMSLSLNPKLLIADEPTTALDVTIQKQILDLLKRLQREFSMAMIFISHDLHVVEKMCEEIAVMYLGEVVELNSSAEIMNRPRHPYTQGLLRSLPGLQKNLAPKSKLYTIQGRVPRLSERPQGCQFSSRCEYQRPQCHSKIELKHNVRCIGTGV